jgi:DNA-binding transcriptional regulator YhcF (GntR family)
MTTEDLPNTDQEENATRLSYKFQRLRERLRLAITSGEIAGKLPGERVLAKRFKVNAKTLSKALTDLAAEGLLDRSIGLGTFVRGAPATKQKHRCLVLRDADDKFADVAALLGCDDLEVHLHDHLHELPPSALSPHRSVIVLSKHVSEKALRDLVVRGKTVVTVERRIKPYITHGVMIDRAGDLCDLARAMIRGGHRKLMIVDDDQYTEVVADVKAAIAPEQAYVRSGSLSDVLAAIGDGVTALLCTRSNTANRAMETCNSFGFAVPQRVSIAAVGRQSEFASITGRYTPPQRVGEAVQQLLREANPHRPITLWLGGDFIDRGTIAPVAQ